MLRKKKRLASRKKKMKKRQNPLLICRAPSKPLEATEINKR